MEHNLLAWMVAFGPHIELASTIRDRNNLHAFLESRRATHASLIDRVRGLGRGKPAEAELDLVCCTA